MATENPTTRTNRTRVLTDTWLKGKTVLTAPEWADKPSHGLRLRVSPKGKKTWFYRYKLNGKTQKITIGFYPGTTLKEARDQWRLLSDLRQKGIDPKTHLQQQVEAKVEGKAEAQQLAELEQAREEHYIVGRLVRDYIDAISPTYRSWERKEADLKRHLKPYLAWRADALSRGDVRDILATLRDANKPVAANRALASIRACYNWALKEDWPIIKENGKNHRLGLLTMNPAWQVTATPETSRERALSDKELRIFLRHLAKSGMPEIYQDALLVDLLTGCRIGEVIAMQWQHIVDDEWRIPGELTKNGRAHTVYLSSQVLTILAKYQGGLYVFSHPDTQRGHIRRGTTGAMLRRALGVNVKVPEASRKNSLGVEPFTPHDLRRTLATWLGENGVDEKIHDRMLNHYKKTVAAIYNRAKLNKPAREWWLKWGEHIQALMTENVVPLRSKK